MNHISPIIHIIDSCIKPIFLRTAIDGYIMLMAELIAVKVFLRLLQTVYIPQFIDFSQSFCLSHISFPCLLDVGQCNDAYSAIQIAVALADAFGCGVNDLPLSMVLSWYEQKAVCILLTLLYLGIKNIRLGPTLPAFISPNILNFLVENYGIAPITTPEEDLKALLK